MSCDVCSDPDCNCAACAQPPLLGAAPNRAGRDALDLRIGDYRRFYADALARLSAPDAGALHALRTRAADDPCIALLDAWAMVADVLTFYRERLSNEGYLRTARDARSLRELAAMAGYRPRPGVAATVHLAYLLDAGAAPVEIPAGARAQSVPLPGEQMQAFETSEPLQARAEWSEMTPRRTRLPALQRVIAMTRPELKLTDSGLFVRAGERVLFVYGDQPGQQVVREVAAAVNDVENGWLALSFKPRPGLSPAWADKLLGLIDDIAVDDSVAPRQGRRQLLQALVSLPLGATALDTLTAVQAVDDNVPLRTEAIEVLREILRFERDEEPRPGQVAIDSVLGVLGRKAPPQLPSARYLQRDALAGLAPHGAQRGALLQTLMPQLQQRLYAAWSKLPASAARRAETPQVYLLRALSSPYGAIAPRPLPRASGVSSVVEADHELQEIDGRFAFLETVNDAIGADSYAVIETPAVRPKAELADYRTLRFAWVRAAHAVGRGDYQISGKVTRLDLVDPASGEAMPVVPHDAQGEPQYRRLDFLRNSVYAVQSEQVTLAPEPIADDIGGDTIALGALYDGLDSGRWIIVAGERTDIVVNGKPVAAMQDGELAMIAAVRQEPDPQAPADPRHTVITLQQPLAYRYRRATLKIYGNVVKATHGETVSEALGSGNAQLRFARIALKRAPLTFTPAAGMDGVSGSQIVRVNELRWQQVDSLLDAGLGQRGYQLAIDDNGAATLCFGDGVHGARLPSGRDNLQASYRVGIGRAGNVKAAQISLLATRPLGVSGVLNPLAASGGAERDGSEQIRRNIPLAVQALAPRSRPVAAGDYAVFARRFAGIGHAAAIRLAGSDGAWLHLTLAGADDIPLEPDGELLANLRAACLRFGDPLLPLALGVRELIVLVLQARVALQPDASWDMVQPRLRARLLDAFSFARRELGQSVWLSEAVAVMQETAGVAWVDVDLFGGISELALRDANLLAAALADLRKQGAAPTVRCLPAAPASTADEDRMRRIQQRDGVVPMFLPAQLVCLLPQAPETLVLNLIDGGA
jgi:hypothetical protein